MVDGRLLEEVEARIRGLPGVVDLIFLDPELKETIIQLERDAECNGAAGGLLPFRNIGVWESLARDVSLVIVFKSGTVVLGASRPVIMVDGRGNVIGEFVDEERRRQMKGRDGVHFLSDDFVIYSNIEVEGDVLFVMPALDFDYIQGVEGVARPTAGSISTLSDHYIRCMMGYQNTKHWTHLVGFDID